MEHWGCPWSRKADGHANVRAFGGMKIERTWFAADKTGFHMLHTLFQTSIKYPSIKRFDEHFCVDLVVEDGRVQGVVAIEIATGEFRLIQAKAVIIATGGAGRVFRENTNGGIVTGDGMALAYRHGVPLRDMEFVQYHPTCMPGTGLLFTEACRGEGGFLLNKDGYRYLQDYGLGPAEPTPRNKAMELGPARPPEPGLLAREAEGPHDRRRRTARWCTWTCATWARRNCASACRRSTSWPSNTSASTRRSEPIPVLPAVHYTMGGIIADGTTASPLPGLYSVGECSSVGIHGANRLGSNSLTELHRLRQGRRRRGGAHSPRAVPHGNAATLWQTGRGGSARARSASSRATRRHRAHRHAAHAKWPRAWKTAAASTAPAATMQATCDKIAELKQRYQRVRVDDHSQGLEHRMAAGASSSATCSTSRRRWCIRRSNRKRIARLAPAAGRLRAARRRQLPQAHAGALRRRRTRRASTTAR